MGWYGTVGGSREDLIDELTESWENDEKTCKVLKRTVKGATLWSVREVEYKDGAKPSVRVICCDRIEKHGDDWMHKPMDETVGPCYYDCPLSYLDLAPDPCEGYSTKWRQKVREYHGAKKGLVVA